jgi:hypothetical protein
MSEKNDPMEFTSQPPVSAMLQGQGTGNKYTNVFMPNQQQATMEYVSEPYIPEEIEKKHALMTMLVKKRALGLETPLESWTNDLEFCLVKILRRMGYQDIAEEEALVHIYHREGQRTHNGFERDHQVMQKTMSQDTLTTITQPTKMGFWSRFAKGRPPTDQPHQQ